MATHLEQKTIASLLLNCGFDAERISHGQIITDNLDAAVGGEVSPSLPVILIEGVLNGDNGVFLNIGEVQIGKFHTGDPFCRITVRVLEVQIIFTLLVELGGSNIECNFDLIGITCLLDGFDKDLKGLLGT